MAEALAIIGLTSNIVSFIDFGLKLVSATRLLRDSSNKTTPEVAELEDILENVKSTNAEILRFRAAGNKLSTDETRILDMVSECERLTTELRRVILKLQKREDVKSKTLESGRVALQSMWKRKEMEGLGERLEKLDRRLRDCLRLSLQSEGDSAILSMLRHLDQTHRKLGINYESKLESIREDIVSLTVMNQKNTEFQIATELAQLASLKTKLDVMERERLICGRQSKVIESLYFPEIRRRWSQIPESENYTNDWIFDKSLTSFSEWLEAQNGMYCITGWAGSGKSTLMKFVSEHDETRRALERWAYPEAVHIASYYVWNQGFEMQKSQSGLLQSLIYQILRYVPSLIPSVCPEHEDYENWDMQDLKDMFQRITKRNTLSTKFCFFIDGLDEYNGEEEDIVKILTFLSSSPLVKICASTRPRSIFEEYFNNPSCTIAIQDFTSAGMKTHIRRKLSENIKFQRLEGSELALEEMTKLISTQAQGVWLWVFLVMRDLVHAVNRDEGLPMLRRIVHQFPPDLTAYFEHIVNGIRKEFRKEMAQIFLIAIDEVQPLPLFAFSLLEKEEVDSQYAVNAVICPIFEEYLTPTYNARKSRIQNRCGDLLIVENGPHPTFLSCPVDFLHRTVREFLQDCVYQQLKEELKSKFSSTAVLAKMGLFLLKSLPTPDFREKGSIHQVIGLVDEILYYAREEEKRSNSLESPMTEVLDELERVNCYYGRSLRNHWTHARDIPSARGDDEYREGGNCNFLALCVQARLVKYVASKLRSNPKSLQKGGRPLLDYALRPRRTTPIQMPYHSQRDDPSVDVSMVRLLLESGADPNQPVHLNGGRTVWALFLLSCYETFRRDLGSPILNEAWYQASELLVQQGARPDSTIHWDKRELTVSTILENIFGEEKAVILLSLMETKMAERMETGQNWMSWLPKISWST